MKYFLEYILLKTNGYNPCYFINFNEEYLYRKINTFPNTFGANLISNTIFKIRFVNNYNYSKFITKKKEYNKIYIIIVIFVQINFNFYHNFFIYLKYFYKH